MTEYCAVCKKPYKKINKSHIATHDMTMEEYTKYMRLKRPEPKEQDIPMRYNKIDFNTFDYRMKYQYYQRSRTALYDISKVFNDKERKCAFCEERLDDLRVYIILTTEQEKSMGRPIAIKNMLHEECAIHASNLDCRIVYADIDIIK